MKQIKSFHRSRETNIIRLPKERKLNTISISIVRAATKLSFVLVVFV